MTMRIIPIHFDIDQAQTIIEFLDQLREAMLDHYGEAIQTDWLNQLEPAQDTGQIDFIEEADF
jgi:hypothetical protein